MKKNYTLLKRSIIAFTLFAITIVYACKKNNEEPENKIAQKDLIEMQTWFKVNMETGLGNPFASMVPKWESVYINNHGEQEVYEFELANPKHIFQAGSIPKKGLEDKYLDKNKIRLLIFMDRVSHKINYGAYMSGIDDSNTNNFSNVHYKSIIGLTGKVLFYNLNGTFANGWVYRGGNITNAISPVSEREYINAQFDMMNLKSAGIKSTREKLQKEVYDPCLMGIPVYGQFCFQIDGYPPNCAYHEIGTTYVNLCEGAGSFGDGGGWGGTAPGGYNPPQNGGGGTGTGENNPEYRDTTNHVTNTCINKGLLKALAKNIKSEIKSLMVNTFMANSTVNLEFSSYPFSPTGLNANADAITTPWNSTNLLSQQIAFNENLLPNKSEEYIVATVYHEVLHAYFANLFSIDQQGKFIVPPDHEYMATNYIKMLSNDLKDIYPNLSETEAWALSWGGLESTSLYNLLTTYEKATISSINKQFSTKPNSSNPNAISKGRYCL